MVQSSKISSVEYICIIERGHRKAGYANAYYKSPGVSLAIIEIDSFICAHAPAINVSPWGAI